MIFLFPLADPGHPAAVRHLTPEVVNEGFGAFARYVRQHIIPACDKLGIPPRVMWWNPFGFHRPSLYDFDQYLLAMENPKLHLAVKSFVESLAPLTDDGVEQWAYIGIDGLHLDRPGDRLWRTVASVRPYLDAGMRLVVDAVANAAPEHPAARAVYSLREHGVPVSVEGKPERDGWEIVGEHKLMQDDQDPRGIATDFPESTIVWVRQRPHPMEEVGRARGYENAGYTPAVNFWGLLGRGVKIEEVW